ncbi:hypothetical protein EYS09_37700, partial [Streptomyces kasugaensis]
VRAWPRTAANGAVRWPRARPEPLRRAPPRLRPGWRYAMSKRTRKRKWRIRKRRANHGRRPS